MVTSRKALLIFLVAGVTDALDGFIARFWGQQSLLGAYLDPIADKLLLTSAYVVLSIPSLNHGAPIPLWVTILVIARDVLIVAVALLTSCASSGSSDSFGSMQVIGDERGGKVPGGVSASGSGAAIESRDRAL